MLELIYIVMFVFTIFLFFIGIGNIFKMTEDTRRLMMFITAMMFIVIILSSFTVESKYCVYTTEFICETIQTQETTMAIVSTFFLIVTVIYVIMSYLNMIPQPNVRKVVKEASD